MVASVTLPDNNFQCIALTFPALPDPSIAIAASRANGVGILDLEYHSDLKTAFQAIDEMSSASKSGTGVKLSGWAGAFAKAIIDKLPENIPFVVLTFSNKKRLQSMIKLAHDRNRTVMLEVTSIEQAVIGEKSGADGFLAKGSEAGGCVGEKTSFILLQQILGRTSLPVWAQGGIGLHTAAACFAAGAAGVVLDFELALTRESPLPEMIKDYIRRMDGTATVRSGSKLLGFHSAKRPKIVMPSDLLCAAAALDSAGPAAAKEKAHLAFYELLSKRINWSPSIDSVWPIGQDAALAAAFDSRCPSVGAIFQAIKKSVRSHISSAKRMTGIFSGSSPLAKAFGTRFPIVQGPMARISDNAAFASGVAEEGALPFIALSQVKPAEISNMLKDVREALGDRPWGIGLLGFNDPEFLHSQIAAAEKFLPRFAIIAGGLPKQVELLEGKGISTYVHIPSAPLLEMFIDAGARKFIFEGNECGGHIGPRTSFMLWETMVASLLDKFRSGLDPNDFHILFAGGIHDGLSASMVAALSAPLSEAGAKIGVVMGTAYLFTEDIVRTEAIAGKYQQNALDCASTCVLEMSPGHALRCCDTPFVGDFTCQQKRLIEEKKPHQEIAAELEKIILGRARIASKGFAKNPAHGSSPSEPYLICVDEQQQQQDGLYMLGQLAALIDKPMSIRELHRSVVEGSAERLRGRSELAEEEHFERTKTPDIAIIGMACIYPKARNIREYWNNILRKVNIITEVPESRWDWRIYFDENRSARDKIYSRWGGFIEDIPFDPMKYGIPPSSLDSIEPLHLMTLEVVDAALRDAGYAEREFPRESTSVIIGTGGGIGDAGQRYIWRSTLPQFFEITSDQVVNRIQEWTEDSFSGILMNVLAGRVANRFNLGGINYTVDAACASSLASVYDAVRELETGSSDIVLAGGADASQNAFTFTCFSKTNALSPTGQCKVFDESADGTVISEGVAMLVLKRLADAERDGDRIYAVIKSVAGSSDGRGMGLTAPKVEGQMLSLRRAYAKAGFSPTTVKLFEAHGTGTAVGDHVEATSLSRTLKEHNADRQSAAIGSVKSMIGHTKGAAGIAGLIKISLALYHKVFPPTMGVTKPNSKMDFLTGPLYVNTEVRPWVGTANHPRRAAASAFGFGGSNFHAIAEEYAAGRAEKCKPAVLDQWQPELLLWSGRSPEEIRSSVSALLKVVSASPALSLCDIAYTLYSAYEKQSEAACRLAIVAASREDLIEKMKIALELVPSAQGNLADPRGVYFSSEVAGPEKIAFLFPGQGSQYPNMLRDAAIHFPEMLACFDRANKVLKDRIPEGLAGHVFPPPAFTEDQEKAYKKNLSQTRIAQPALGIAGYAMYKLLRVLGLNPDMSAGHSYGEYVALAAAGVMDEETLYELSEARGRFCAEAASGSDLGTMVAVAASASDLRSMLQGIEGVTIANINAPLQTVLSGSRQAIAQAIDLLKSRGIPATQIPVSGAFHSPFVEPARQRLADYMKTLSFNAPESTVFSNTHAAPYGNSTADIIACLSDHMIKPVEFVREVEAMYDAGARIFIEVGPGAVLTNLTKQILDNRPVLCLATDMKGQPGLRQLLTTVAQLAVRGVQMKLGRLFAGRSVKKIDLNSPHSGKDLSDGWRVNGTRVLGPKNTWKQRSEDIPLATYRVRDRRKKRDAASGVTAGSDKPLEAPSQQPMHQDTTAASGAFSLPQMPQGSIDKDMILLQYQQMMNKFLDTQKSIITAYLQGGAVSPELQLPQIKPAMAPARPVISETVRADARVGAAPAQEKVAAAAETPAAYIAESSQKTDTAGQLKGTLLKITSERTGYPEEMLKPDLDIEADLGIDSIKRVEIMGAFVKGLNESEQQKLRPMLEELSRLRTLGAIIEKARETLGGPSAQLAPAPEAIPQAMTISGERLKQELLRITSERTGYPEEMLKADLDIEADLGIDSIKRVEIMGAFVKGMNESEQQKLRPMLEELSRLRTLGAIIEKARETLAGPAAQLAPTEAQNEKKLAVPASGPVAAEFVPRFVAVPIPIGRSGQSGKKVAIPKGGTFLITDDGVGIADIVAQEIRSLGGEAVILKMTRGDSVINGETCSFDLTDSAQVSAAVEIIWNSKKQIVGLIHLLPLGHSISFADMQLRQWRDCMQEEMKSLYLLARALSVDLKKNRGWLISATSLAGDAGMDGAFAGQAGSAGFLKSIAQEWPEVICRVLHLEASGKPEQLAAKILEEMAETGPVEIENQLSDRIAMGVAAESLHGAMPVQIDIEKEWVILITGGAAGITAEIARTIAAKYQPTLILVGRSALPGEESPETAGLTDAGEIKARLIGQFRSRGETPTPAVIETALARLMHNREMQRNIERMRACGANVHYFSADVRDEESFGGLIENIYASFHRLDGVIHGAGTIEDRLVENKTPDSFNRVFDTKVDSAFILSKKLRPESLRFIVFFASVAGFFGNRGQSDYAAANEVVNRLASYLDSIWPCRIVSMNWGPWKKFGMVTPEIERQFRERGVQIIPPEAGCRLLDEEIRFGRKGIVKVVLGNGPWERMVGAASAFGSLPLFSNGRRTHVKDGSMSIVRTLDPGHDLYLRDHCLDGNPVLPTAMAVELMAETAKLGWPEWNVITVKEVRLLKGIILERGPRDITITAKEVANQDNSLELEVGIAGAEKPGSIFYRSKVIMAKYPPAERTYAVPDKQAMARFRMSTGEAYEKWLFHGPLFQCIRSADGISKHGMTWTVTPSSTAECIAGATGSRWLIDPIVLDSGPQAAILWAREHRDITVLPAQFKAVHIFNSWPSHDVRCHLEVVEAGEQSMVANIYFAGADNQLICAVEGFEAAGNKALNRLSGKKDFIS